MRFSRPTGPNRRLADLTINKVQFVKLGRLYGRDKECQLLSDAWEEVRLSWRWAHQPDATAASSSAAASSAAAAAAVSCVDPPRSSYSRRFVSIAGASGTGKSTLAEMLREPVLKAGGFFLLGKFPQQHGLLSRHAMQPYAAFEAACNDLCELLVSLYTPHSQDNSSNHADDTYGSSSFHDSHSGPGFGEDDESTVLSWRHLKITLAHVRKRLDRDLGADATILTRVIPSLLQVLSAQNGASSTEESIGYREAHHQFKFAFRRFLRAIASFGPVVLVLDDLQWADAASMELMEALVSDRENPALLVIGCYRDDIEYGTMPHLTTLGNVRAMAAQSEDGNTDDFRCDGISIGNLGEDQVHQLLVDLLSLSESETRDLAECVHKRTLGNIFFVIQYVTMLQEAELLQYNIGASKWTFDLEAIRISTAATDNVVSLMTNKMKRLPRRLQHFLPVMACLGTTFSVSVFVLLFHHFADVREAETENGFVDESSHHDNAEEVAALARKQTPQECLADCEEEGFIVSSSNASEGLYQWVHDKIHEAAFSLVSNNELRALRLEIGRVLFEKLDPLGLDQNIFTVVNLITTERPENLPLPPVQVARLYLTAGTKTMENSAFEQAAGYLAKGIGLLPTQCWNDHYHLTLELYSTAAEAEFCVGNFARMRLYCNQVLDQTERPILEKRRAYNVLLDGTAAEEGMWAAFAFCRSLLAKLGCHFPKTSWGVKFHVRAVIMLIRAGRRKYTASETISQLSLMDDETKQWLMVLIDKFSAFTYLTHPAMLPSVIFKGLRLTMAHGVSDSAPNIFSFVGLLLAAFVNDFKGGQAFADQAIALLKVVRHSRKNECRVVYLSHALVLHWTRPAALSIKPLLTSYEVGMAMGDTGSACWSIYFHIVFSFRTGTSLKVVLEECAFYADVMREVKQRTIVLDMLLNIWQVVLHLTGANPYSGLLNGDVRSQEDALRSVKKDDYETLRSSLLMRQAYVAFVLGRHEIVYEIIRLKTMDNGCYGKCSPVGGTLLLSDPCQRSELTQVQFPTWPEKIFAGILELGHLYGCNGLSMMSLYHRTKDTKYLKLAKCFAKKIKLWVGAGVSGSIAVVCY